jgi:hypothetical protein
MGERNKYYGFPQRHTNKVMDPKEYMIREIQTEMRPPHTELNLPNPSLPHGFSDQYLILDTFRKNPTSDITNGVFQFNLMIQGATDKFVIGVRERLNNIVEMQIGAFYIQALPPHPLPSDMTLNGFSTLITGSTSFPQYFPGQEITVQVAECGTQSISDIKGNRHHFDLTINYNTITTSTGNTYAPIASPDLNYWDSYKFTDPIMDITSLTLVFRSPDIGLSFLPDVYYNCPTTYTLGVLSFNIPNHGLNPDDVIIIEGFTSNYQQANNIINSSSGILVGLVPDVNSFQTNPKFTFAPTIPDISYVNIYVLKRRMRIPIRLRRMISRTTNYILPAST